MTLDQVASMELLRASSRMIQPKLANVLSTTVDGAKTHDVTECCPRHPQNHPHLSMGSIRSGRIVFGESASKSDASATPPPPLLPRRLSATSDRALRVVRSAPRFKKKVSRSRV